MRSQMREDMLISFSASRPTHPMNPFRAPDPGRSDLRQFFYLAWDYSEARNDFFGGMTTLSSYKTYVRGCRLFSAILALSLALSLWGIQWGAPKVWHPDEITSGTLNMALNRTIIPPSFFYGGLHYYTVGVTAIAPVYLQGLVFDPPPPREDRLARAGWWETRWTWMIVMARGISAVMSTAVILFTFVIGKTLFDKSTGYLASGFLCISMSFMAVAHFATVDSPANFWFWLSCLFALLIWKRGARSWYVLASITAGFALGIKLDRAVILLPLVLSHFLRGEGPQLRRLITLAIFVPAGYFLANPALFTSGFQFLDGFTRDMFYQALKGRGPEQSSYLQLFQDLKAGLGLPLLLTVLLGLAYGFYNLALKKNTAAIIWLLSTFLPYYIIFGSTSVQSWYLTVLFPALMILAAAGCVNLIGASPQPYAFLAKFAVAGVVVYSFFYTVALVLQFSNDSRYLAAEWIERNVPVNSIIEIGERGPLISESKYKVIESSRDPVSMDYARAQYENLERYRPYQIIRQFILDAEKWAGQNLGLQVRKQPYMNWIDNLARNTPASQEIILPEAEYIVLLEDLYPEKLSKLAASGSEYRLAAKCHFVDSFGLGPEFQFVNPPVFIFQRVTLNVMPSQANCRSTS